MQRTFARKGQWFIISAVIASGALLALSVLFKGYFATDTAKLPLVDEHYYYGGMKGGLDKVFALSCAGGSELPGQDVRRNYKEFIQLNRNHFTSIGYILAIVPDEVDVDLDSADTLCTQRMGYISLLLIKSDRAEVWEGDRPEVVVG